MKITIKKKTLKKIAIIFLVLLIITAVFFIFKKEPEKEYLYYNFTEMLEKGYVQENKGDFDDKPYQLHTSECIHTQGVEAVECLNNQFKGFYVERDLKGVWVDEKAFIEYGGTPSETCKWYLTHLKRIGGFETVAKSLSTGHCVLLTSFNEKEYCLINGYDLYCSSI